MDCVTLTKIKDVAVVGRYSNCGCIELNSRYQEFPIPDSIVIHPKLNLIRQNSDEIDCLKEKVICEYNEILRLGGIGSEDTDKDIFLVAKKNGQYGLIKNKKVF